MCIRDRVNVVHNGIGTGGTATWSPQKTTYVYGDVVTLNATLLSLIHISEPTRPY